MNKNMIWIIAVIVAVGLFVGAYFLYGSLSEGYAPDGLMSVTEDGTDPVSTKGDGTEGDETKEPDYSAPDFTMYDADGNDVRLSDFFGNPIVLNFWASWCSPCKMEMPHFDDACGENPDVQFIMLNVTSSDNRSDADSLIAKEGYTFPVYYDTKGYASMTYGTSSLPTTFFIDRDGNLVTYAVGMINAATLERGIELIK